MSHVHVLYVRNQHTAYAARTQEREREKEINVNEENRSSSSRNMFSPLLDIDDERKHNTFSCIE